MNSAAFTFLFKLALLVELVTHAKFTCEFVSFWKHACVWNEVWIVLSPLRIVWLIEIFAPVTVLSSPALTATALLEVALIVVGVIIGITLVIAGPS
jgi:hypothetical protein